MKLFMSIALGTALMVMQPLTSQGQKSNAGPVNSLSSEEVIEGYQLLFNGKTTDQWRGAYQKYFPEKGWVVKEGLLIHEKAEGGESVSGGDIITNKEYNHFMLSLEWRVAEGGNSGIKYFVKEVEPRTAGSALGLEYQILDEAKHPDALMGIEGNRKAAGLYDLIAPPRDKYMKPPGKWNHAVIYSVGNMVRHFLNGKMTVEYERNTPTFAKLVAESKYKDKPNFGTYTEGHILLQDHGDEVAFRSIKIKIFPDPGKKK